MAGRSQGTGQNAVEGFGWAAREPSGILSPFKFLRRVPDEHDVQVKVLYCGICDWDLSVVKNLVGTTNYPVVPGHEIVGIATEVGKKVQKFKVGDKVGVCGIVGSCGKCERCTSGYENYCPSIVLIDGSALGNGSMTIGNTSGYMGTDETNKLYGGLCDTVVVDEHFMILWPENYPLDVGPPLLCAGITTYSPLRYYGLDKPGLHVGVVGFGGLGHLAVKFAKAFGAKVTVIDVSIKKKQDAIERFGVDSFLLSNDQQQMQAAAGTLDGILDTVAQFHSLSPLINLLKFEGMLILLGAAREPFELPAVSIMAGKKKVLGSSAGSIKEMQEMMEFAAKHNILPDAEIIPVDYLNTAMERIEIGDVKYRLVVDIGKSLKFD